jgi:hypothetical protein
MLDGTGVCRFNQQKLGPQAPVSLVLMASPAEPTVTGNPATGSETSKIVHRTAATAIAHRVIRTLQNIHRTCRISLSVTMVVVLNCLTTLEFPCRQTDRD